MGVKIVAMYPPLVISEAKEIGLEENTASCVFKNSFAKSSLDTTMTWVFRKRIHMIYVPSGLTSNTYIWKVASQVFEIKSKRFRMKKRLAVRVFVLLPIGYGGLSRAVRIGVEMGRFTSLGGDLTQSYNDFYLLVRWHFNLNEDSFRKASFGRLFMIWGMLYDNLIENEKLHHTQLEVEAINFSYEVHISPRLWLEFHLFTLYKYRFKAELS
ncbi:hypothetical protein LguiA_002755 [Lonicera macranthoides]